MNARILLIGLIVLASSGLLLAGQQHGQQPDQAARAPQTPEQMQEHCQMMAQHMEEAHQKMEQMDRQLQDKLTAMRNARGDDRVDAMAAVVEELVTQRQQMHEQHRGMMHGAMQHMGKHAAIGMQGQAQSAMMHCPMMQAQGEVHQQRGGAGEGQRPPQQD